MSTYRVAAPYVTLRFMDPMAGKWVLHGLYVGAILPAGVHEEDLARHLRKGMVVEVDEAPATPEPTGPTPAEEPRPETQLNESVPPAQSASKADWVAYAVSQRAEDVSEEQAAADAEAMTKADLIASFGG